MQLSTNRPEQPDVSVYCVNSAGSTRIPASDKVVLMTSFSPDRHGGTPEAEAHRRALRTGNILVGAMALALVVLGAVLAMIGTELATPETWMLGLVVVATVAAWGAVLAPPQRRGPGSALLANVHTTVVLRVALLEAPAILGFALAFLASPPNLLLYAVPAAFSLLGIALFARPRLVLEQLSAAA